MRVENIYTQFELRPGMERVIQALFDDATDERFALLCFRILGGRRAGDVTAMAVSMLERFGTSRRECVRHLIEVSLPPAMREPVDVTPSLSTFDLERSDRDEALFAVGFASVLRASPPFGRRLGRMLDGRRHDVWCSLPTLTSDDRIERRTLAVVVGMLRADDPEAHAHLPLLAQQLVAGTKSDALGFAILRLLESSDEIDTSTAAEVERYRSEMETIGGFDRLVTYRAPVERILATIVSRRTSRQRR